MPYPVNLRVAARLEEVARLLERQAASPFRVQAYQRAAETVRAMTEPVSDVLRRGGLTALQALPGIGESLARAIQTLVLTGRLPMLQRLRGESGAAALLATVPGIGAVLAERLHQRLGIDTLEDLEAAAYDGRLAHVRLIGRKRLDAIRDSLATRLGRIRLPPAPGAALPSVDEILAVDRDYRRRVAAGDLPRIAPRRFNPTHEAWLPVFHTQLGVRHYTALFSNTARAHELGRTRDWVVIYADGDQERQYTVVTARLGPLKGRRVVRGREAECLGYYRPAGPGSTVAGLVR
jgi:hypothetical protein